MTEKAMLIALISLVTKLLEHLEEANILPPESTDALLTEVIENNAQQMSSDNQIATALLQQIQAELKIKRDNPAAT